MLTLTMLLELVWDFTSTQRPASSRHISAVCGRRSTSPSTCLCCTRSATLDTVFMRLGSLWRSTSFRLAVSFACIFVTGFLIAGVITYQLFKRELLDNLDRSISEVHSVIGSTYGDNDLEDLLISVDNYARLNRPQRQGVCPD